MEVECQRRKNRGVAGVESIWGGVCDSGVKQGKNLGVSPSPFFPLLLSVVEVTIENCFPVVWEIVPDAECGG